jgi:Na+-transporting methylmalonyl-CoA/oxaloacetate decarboxylase gamma subunit
MWIILGVLISVVVGFLIISAVLDKKKRKQASIKEKEAQESKKQARGRVAILANVIVKENQKKLKEFIPSIGQLKMSDINNLAKDALEQIQKLSCFVLAKEDEEFVNQFNLLLKNKSNNWLKQNKKQIIFMQKFEESLNLNDYKSFKEEESIKIIKGYK